MWPIFFITTDHFELNRKFMFLEHNLFLTEIPGNIQSLQKTYGRWRWRWATWHDTGKLQSRISIQFYIILIFKLFYSQVFCDLIFFSWIFFCVWKFSTFCLTLGIRIFSFQESLKRAITKWIFLFSGSNDAVIQRCFLFTNIE